MIDAWTSCLTTAGALPLARPYATSWTKLPGSHPPADAWSCLPRAAVALVPQWEPKPCHRERERRAPPRAIPVGIRLTLVIEVVNGAEPRAQGGLGVPDLPISSSCHGHPRAPCPTMM